MSALNAAIRFVAILATGWFIGFWVIRSGGTPIEAMIISLIVTSFLGTIGRILEGEREEE